MSKSLKTEQKTSNQRHLLRTFENTYEKKTTTENYQIEKVTEAIRPYKTITKKVERETKTIKKKEDVKEHSKENICVNDEKEAKNEKKNINDEKYKERSLMKNEKKENNGENQKNNEKEAKNEKKNVNDEI